MEFVEYIGHFDDFIAEGGHIKLEHTDPDFHGLVVMGRHRMDLTRTFAGGHRPNNSLLKTDKEQQEIWSGNIVAYGMTNNNRVVDIVLIDLRPVAGILRHIYDRRRREHIERIDDSTVVGAFISCAA